ncbi:MAG: PilT/PilU family type 4a pilus ATPase [Planctomycetaceae bacterium]|nr:PilT/PilU family type 4a pilus ATPase [Planctomycetaceae bacterium]
MAHAAPAAPSSAGLGGLNKARVELEINKLFRALIKFGGSDLHLKVGKPATIRVRGGLRELDMPAINEEEMKRLILPMMDERQLQIFYEEGGADFAHVVEYENDQGKKEPWRFRVNLLIQMGNPGMVSRKVERSIPNFEGLYLPPVIETLCHFDQGMVLLAGVTGSGKSTTIASMLDYINHNERLHILTIEDPIEFVYTEDKALINQREVGVDVKDFKIAMKHAVRQDPDIMLVGEMRDMETFETAMHAAETGHLVFGTIHASSAPSTIGRILDLFPREMHPALRGSMSFNLKAIVAQKLLPTIRDTPKRVPIVEIMLMNGTVRKLILEEKDEKLFDAMRIGKDDGMQMFNDSLYHFVTKEYVSRAAAFEISPNVEQLKMMLKGIDVKGPGIL